MRTNEDVATDATNDIKRIADALVAAGLATVMLSDLEAAAMLNALRLSGGSRTGAAKLLGCSSRTIQRTIKAGKFTDPSGEAGEQIRLPH